MAFQMCFSRDLTIILLLVNGYVADEFRYRFHILNIRLWAENSNLFFFMSVCVSMYASDIMIHCLKKNRQICSHYPMKEAHYRSHLF